MLPTSYRRNTRRYVQRKEFSVLLFSVGKVVSYLSYFLECEAERLSHIRASLEELVGQVNKIEETRLQVWTAFIHSGGLRNSDVKLLSCCWL